MLPYVEFSDNFGNFEEKLDNSKVSVINNKNDINTINYSNSGKINIENIRAKYNKSVIEESLQQIEQLFVTHLGSDYLREILFSHYGSWLPKYGFFGNSNNLKFNPDRLSC